MGYAYTCIAAYTVATVGIARATPWDRVSAAGGGVLALGFILLLCVPGMPAFMAPPSWVALGLWVVLGLTFYLGRARRYASIPTRDLDRLILGRHLDAV